MPLCLSGKNRLSAHKVPPKTDFPFKYTDYHYSILFFVYHGIMI